MLRLDMRDVAKSGLNKPEEISALQVAVYVACGGGHLGLFAAQQPADFYIDDRCGRLPYRRKEIMQAVQVLAVLAERAGLDPRNMPHLPDFHACGTW